MTSLTLGQKVKAKVFSVVSDSLHGILQARKLEWVAFPSTRDLPNPEIEPRSPVLPED